MENFFNQGLSWLENWKESQEKLAKQYEDWGQMFQEKKETKDQSKTTDSIFQDWIETQSKLSKQFLEMGQSFQENWKTQNKMQEDTQKWMGFQIYQQVFQTWLDALNQLPGVGDFSKFQAGFGQNKNPFEDLLKNNPFAPWGQNQNLGQEFQKVFNVLETWIPHFSGPYQTLIQEFMENLSQNRTDWGSETTKEFLDEYEQQFTKYLSTQQLGLHRERNEKIAKTFTAFIDHCKVTEDLMKIVQEASNEANTNITKKLTELASEGKTISSFKELASLWTGENEAVFQKIMATPSYAKIQGDHLKTYCQYKQLLNELLEEALRETPFATNSDLDLAFKEIHHLKSELRTSKAGTQKLTREMSQLKVELQSLKTGIKELLDAKGEKKSVSSSSNPKTKRNTKTTKK